MKNLLPAVCISLTILAGCEPDKPNRQSLQQPVLTVSNSNDTVYFSWNKVPSANKYEVFFRNPKIASSNFVLAQNISDTRAYSTNFYPLTKYQGWARAIDTTVLNMSPADVAVEFTTPCMPFRALNIADVSQTSSIVSWMGSMPNDRSDIASFSLLLRVKDSQNFTTHETTQHSYTFDQLTRATDYEVKLSFVCTDGKDYATDWKTFTTQ